MTLTRPVPTMKLQLTPSVSARVFENALTDAMNLGANCAIVTPLGRKPYTYGLVQLSSFIGHTAEIVFGKRNAPGLPVKVINAPEWRVPQTPEVQLDEFIASAASAITTENLAPSVSVEVPPAPLSFAKMNKLAKQIGRRMADDIDREIVRQVTTDDSGQTAPAKAAPRARPRRVVSGTPANRSQGTGYIAAIDALLLDVVPGEVQGRKRSKWTVDEAVQKLLRRFPGKSPASVKRVVKVRPRHLEKIKGPNGFHETDNPAPRWAWVGPGHGTGFMHRIDEFLTQGGKTTAEIAQIVGREYHKKPAEVRKVVQMRTSQYEARYGKPAKFVRIGKKPRTKAEQQRDRAALKRRNLQLLRAARRS